MAHDLTVRKSGQVEMAYVGEKPWHGLGEQLQPGASIETWLKAAGMDWKVQRAKVRYATRAAEGGSMTAYKLDDLAVWDDYHVLLRSDTKAPVGMVSDQFKIVQPREVLEFFRDLVEVAGFTLETAGTLRGGSKFWALASIQAEDRVVGNDLVKGRLMLATACDGSMKTTAKNVAVRVVCANTLAIAMGEKGSPEVAVSHRSKFDAKVVKAQLGVAVDSFHRFILEARTLAARRVTLIESQRFVGGLVDGKVNAAQSSEKIVEAMNSVVEMRSYQRILELFQGSGRGANLPGAKGTAWGLLNAVTEYVDHDRPTRGDASNRLNSAWFGSGNDLKTRAYDAALALVA